MSKTNSGKPLEKLVDMIAKEYDRQHVARLRKCDPPTAYVRGHVVNLRNPWPDFVGSWTSKGGRLLMVECKSTAEDFLPVGSSGVRDEQVEALTSWAVAGAACFVLWSSSDLSKLRLIPIDTLIHRLTTPGAVKRIRDGQPGVWPVDRGTGRIVFDFLSTAALRWP